jgi:hypothetical protein
VSKESKAEQPKRAFGLSGNAVCREDRTIDQIRHARQCLVDRGRESSHLSGVGTADTAWKQTGKEGRFLSDSDRLSL